MLKQVVVVHDAPGVYVEIPLTINGGKARMKRRTSFEEYGEMYAVTQEPMTARNYIEWQIGYDIPVKRDKRDKRDTSIKDRTFRGSNQKLKYGYELSEILYYSKLNGLVSIDQIKSVYSDIVNIDLDRVFERNQKLAPARTHSIIAEYNGVEFRSLAVTYQILVKQFGKYDVFTEVSIKEQQLGSGIQGMLYICLPITELQFKEMPIGRVVKSKECARWVIGKEEGKFVLEVFRIFGMISESHRQDVISIFQMLFPELELNK